MFLLRDRVLIFLSFCHIYTHIYTSMSCFLPSIRRKVQNNIFKKKTKLKYYKRLALFLIFDVKQNGMMDEILVYY